MSVPVSKRNPSKLQFMDNAFILCETAMRISRSFPKRFGHSFTDKFINTTLNGLQSVKMANSIWIKTPEEAGLRKRYFQEAIGYYELLATLIELASRSFGMKPENRQKLAELTYNEIQLIKGLLRFDKEQFKSPF